MRTSSHRQLALGAWLAVVVLIAAGLLMSRAASAPAEIDYGIIEVVLASMGAVLMARVPTSVIGPILLGAALVGAVGILAGGYADLALITGAGSQRLNEVAAAIRSASWAPATFAPLTFLLMLFPDGRLPSPRWRWLPWASAVGIVSTAAFVTFNPEPDNRWAQIDRGPTLAIGEGSPLYVALSLGMTLLVIGLLGTAFSLIVRFRRASGDEHQQMKWVVYGGAIAVPLWLATGGALDETLIGAIGSAIALLLIPTSIAIAILRYRLYAIDRLISRTVTYTLVIALLGLVFSALAIGLPQLVDLPVRSPLLVAASTLAVAALFNPLRRRVQDRVDRRFNRARYDAQQEVERFAERLRAEMELDDLTDEVLNVVSETLQPRAASMWIRGSDR